MDEKNSSVYQFHPKKIFLFGVLGGLLAFGTIGFLVLGTILIRSGGRNVAVATGGNAVGTIGIGHLPAQGSQDAEVTIVEFADFRCPFCQRFFQDSGSGIMRDYVATGKVRYYFRHFAFLGHESTLTHEAAECANEQGKFWQFHDWLYENQAAESDTKYYSAENLVQYATNMGLNKSKFDSCLRSHKYEKQVSQDLSDGQNAGVNGIPTIFINGRPLIGAQPYGAVKAAIEEALANNLGWNSTTGVTSRQTI